ncbi:hypothetical protein ACKWTF_008198 [Chironomus riparius]
MIFKLLQRSNQLDDIQKVHNRQKLSIIHLLSFNFSCPEMRPNNSTIKIHQVHKYLINTKHPQIISLFIYKTAVICINVLCPTMFCVCCCHLIIHQFNYLEVIL